MKMIKSLALAMFALAAGAAQAGTYAFSYQSNNGVLSGIFRGTLQADTNIVVIKQLVGSISLDGVPRPALPFLLTSSTIYDVPTTPRVTFDGSILDFAACELVFCTGEGSEGVIFDTPGIVAFEPRILSSASFGAIDEAPDAGNWSLTAVPEPASWALMIAGFGMVGGAARRRNRVSFAIA